MWFIIINYHFLPFWTELFQTCWDIMDPTTILKVFSGNFFKFFFRCKWVFQNFKELFEHSFEISTKKGILYWVGIFFQHFFLGKALSKTEQGTKGAGDSSCLLHIWKFSVQVGNSQCKVGNFLFQLEKLRVALKN